MTKWKKILFKKIKNKRFDETKNLMGMQLPVGEMESTSLLGGPWSQQFKEEFDSCSVPAIARESLVHVWKGPHEKIKFQKIESSVENWGISSNFGITYEVEFNQDI